MYPNTNVRSRPERRRQDRAVFELKPIDKVIPSCVDVSSEKTGAPPTKHARLEKAVSRVQGDFSFVISTRFRCSKRQVIALVSRAF